jgi:hypothetical protein
MTKKVSLRDAFVRNLPAQQAVDTAVQPAVDLYQSPGQGSAAGYTATQPAVEPPIQPAVPPPIQPASQQAIREAIHTAIQRSRKKATFNLDASLHQRLKIAAALHSREMVDIVEDALLAYLPALDHNAFQPKGMSRP